MCSEGWSISPQDRAGIAQPEEDKALGRLYCHMGFQHFKGAHNKDGNKLSIRACCNRKKAKVLR